MDFFIRHFFINFFYTYNWQKIVGNWNYNMYIFAGLGNELQYSMLGNGPHV